MHAALRRVDIVGKGNDDLIVSVVILQGNFRLGAFFFSVHINDIIMSLGFVSVYKGNKLADSPLITHLVLLLMTTAPVLRDDFKAGVQKSLLSHVGMQGFIIKNRFIKDARIGMKPHDGSGSVRIANDSDFLRDFSSGEFHLIDFAVFVDADLQPVGKGVHN